MITLSRFSARVWLAALVMVMITACSGGGGSPVDPPYPPPKPKPDVTVSFTPDNSQILKSDLDGSGTLIHLKATISGAQTANLLWLINGTEVARGVTEVDHRLSVNPDTGNEVCLQDKPSGVKVCKKYKVLPVLKGSVHTINDGDQSFVVGSYVKIWSGSVRDSAQVKADGTFLISSLVIKDQFCMEFSPKNSKVLRVARRCDYTLNHVQGDSMSIVASPYEYEFKAGLLKGHRYAIDLDAVFHRVKATGSAGAFKWFDTYYPIDDKGKPFLFGWAKKDLPIKVMAVPGELSEDEISKFWEYLNESQKYAEQTYFVPAPYVAGLTKNVVYLRKIDTNGPSNSDPDWVGSDFAMCTVNFNKNGNGLERGYTSAHEMRHCEGLGHMYVGDNGGDDKCPFDTIMMSDCGTNEKEFPLDEMYVALKDSALELMRKYHARMGLAEAWSGGWH